VGEQELKLGDTGEWVTYLRQCLEATGAVLVAGDSYDDNLATSVMLFKTGQGMTDADGSIVDQATWDALRAAAGAGGAAAGADGGEAEPTHEPVDMDIVADCAFDHHDIIVWPGSPARPVAPASQILYHELHAPDGDVIGSGEAHFPDYGVVIGPEAYAIVRIMELSRSPGQGYKLVLQVNPSIGGKRIELALNVDEHRNWQKAF
jgi:hypothetical protein